jgi:hypothetical protein
MDGQLQFAEAMCIPQFPYAAWQTRGRFLLLLSKCKIRMVAKRRLELRQRKARLCTLILVNTYIFPFLRDTGIDRDKEGDAVDVS